MKLKKHPQDLRQRVATEAATLLYFGAEKEYKQAKQKAAETLGTHFLPTNREVALELSRIADENEGPARQKRLVQMRREALEIMTTLKQFNPVLIGSVWRGTIRRGSDIDIALCHNTPNDIVKLLAENNVKIGQAEWTTVTKHGKTLAAFHVHAETATGYKVEITVRSEDEAGKERKCEIFGDTMTGLNIKELEKVLMENPEAQFIPI
jgi:predicted nucleotidyltransferase